MDEHGASGVPDGAGSAGREGTGINRWHALAHPERRA